MKKKGFTMVELMISIAIIAVVMVFLVRLLIDVKYDSTNELYNTANQINRAEIIKTIQEDLNGKRVIGIDDILSTKKVLNIELEVENAGTATINVDEDNYLSYTATDGKKTKWKLEANNKETYIQKVDVPYTVIKTATIVDQDGNSTPAGDTSDYAIIIDIPVIIDNSKLRTTNDSKMDNIILTFYGYGTNDNISSKDFLNPSEQY